MSALFGIFQTGCNGVSPESAGMISTANAPFGPDGYGRWRRENIFLGHHKLVVTKEQCNASFPFVSSCKRYVVVADIRLDNYRDLTAKLRLADIEKTRIHDGALLIKCYEEWGQSCASQLLGDFAFAIWDNKEKKLFCARDHMGLKPLYYYNSCGFFAFSSHLQGLLSIPEIPKKLNEQLIADYLVKVNDGFHEQTYYRDIFLLKPAHQLCVTLSGMSIKRYWRPDLGRQIRFRSESDYIEAYLEILRQSVADRVQGSYPVSLMLSGGLDSNTIAHLAPEKLKTQDTPLHTFSFVMPENESGCGIDERHLIQLAHEKNNIEGHYITLENSSYSRTLERSASFSDMPAIIIHDYLLQTADRAKEKNVRVWLEGYGGDALASSHDFGVLNEYLRTYRWARFIYESHKKAKYRHWSHLRLMFSSMTSLFHTHRSEKEILDWAKGMVGHKSMITPSLADRTDCQSRVIESETLRTLGCRNLRETQWYYLSHGKTSFTINSLVRFLASFNIEYRLPLLDKRLIEFCLSVPPELHLNGWTRNLIRKAMTDKLPDPVLYMENKNVTNTPGLRAFIQKSNRTIKMKLDEFNDNPMIKDYIDLKRLGSPSFLKSPPSALNSAGPHEPGWGGWMRGFHMACFLDWFSKTH